MVMSSWREGGNLHSVRVLAGRNGLGRKPNGPDYVV
jgi:hypothetical protein